MKRIVVEKIQIINIKYFSKMLGDRWMRNDCLANQIKLKPQLELKEANTKLTILPQNLGSLRIWKHQVSLKVRCYLSLQI